MMPITVDLTANHMTPMMQAEINVSRGFLEAGYKNANLFLCFFLLFFVSLFVSLFVSSFFS